MNKISLRGNWNEIKGKLKQEYANLTDDDLRFIEGKEEELLGRLQLHRPDPGTIAAGNREALTYPAQRITLRSGYWSCPEYHLLPGPRA